MRSSRRPCRVLLALASLVPLASASCARPDDLAAIPVGTATLTDLVFAGMAVTAGGRAGTATLELEEPDGTPHFVPVTVRGAIVGLMMDVGFTDLEARADFDLSRVGDPHGDDLLGPYDGFVAEGGMLIGGAYHDLKNDRDARIELGGFAIDVGMSAIVGHEWLSIDVDTDPPSRDADADAGSLDEIKPDGDTDAGPVDGGEPAGDAGEAGVLDGGGP